MTNGTVRKMTDGQRGDIIATMAVAIPTDYSFDDAQRGVIGDKGSFVDDIRAIFERRRKTPKVPQLSTYPEVNRVFTMLLNANLIKNDPDQMARSDGYPGLKYRGDMKVLGFRARSFKFVEIGFQPSFEAVTTELVKRGKIPEGQWREAVKKNFHANGRPMGVPDASWSGPVDGWFFPCVGGSGKSGFSWAGSSFGGGWLWLVLAE